MLLGYVKSRATFKQTHKLQIVDFDYCINSAYENVSMFIVIGEHSGLEDSFFVCDEFFGVITSCTPDKGLTTIQCAKIVTIFGRQLVLTEGESYIEDFMKRVIEDEFKNLSDSVYAMPYINVTITSHTAYSRPVNDNKIWQLEKYISRVKRLFDIYTDITVDNNTLQVTIGHRNVPTHNVDFATSAFELISETYSSEAVSKISVVGEGAITDYYLFDDGTYGTDPTQGTRVKGKWEFRESADNIGYVFASNMDSHLIQFRSFKRFEFGDKLCIRSNGRVTYTYINQILRDSKDDRYLYKTGQITETASETISEQGEDIADIQQELEFNTVKKDGDSDVNGSISVTGSLSSDGDIYEGGVKLSDKYGGNAPTLLWTNTSPTSNFGAQTVSLSQSANDFDTLIVVARYSTTDAYWKEELVGIDGKPYSVTVHSVNYNYNRLRWFTANGTSLTISIAQQLSIGGAVSETSNHCIPVSVYGIQFKGPKGDRGPSGAAPVLLWTNSNPSASFSAQTINFDLSSYGFVMIDCVATKDYANHLGLQTYEVGWTNCRYQASVSNKIGQRNIDSITTTGIVFGSGYVYGSYGASPTVDNTVVIPYRIYGVL